jgi:hypothetical protein
VVDDRKQTCSIEAILEKDNYVVQQIQAGQR